MKKVIVLLSIVFLIGIGLGILGSQIQYHKEKELRKRRIINLEEIIRGQEEKMKPLQIKVNEQQVEIKRLQTKLSEQQEEMRQLETGINETRAKQTAQDEDLKEVLESLGDKRIFFP